MAVERSRLRMTDDELDAFLEQQRVLRMAVVDGDGWPHVVPLWFAWHEGRFWVNNLDRSRRTAMLEAGTRASVVVDAGYEYEELRGASGRVDYRFVEEAEDTTEVRRLFGRKYFDIEEPVPDMRSHTWMELTPRRLRTWDFRKMSASP